MQQADGVEMTKADAKFVADFKAKTAPIEAEWVKEAEAKGLKNAGRGAGRVPRRDRQAAVNHRPARSAVERTGHPGAAAVAAAAGRFYVAAE